MFESWVSDLLASSLGHFIDVQKDKLRVSLWNGVVIENASIRKDAFDYLDLPFKVHYGCIERLQLQVPWRALRSSPIVVELSGVTLAASPREESEWCGDAAARRAMAAKQAQLAAAELEKLSAKVAAERGGDGKRWLVMSHLWSLLLRRVQLCIRNVHILFECPQSPRFLGFSFGMRVGSVETIDESLELVRSKEASTVGEIMKAVAVEEVEVYWQDSDSDEVVDSDYIIQPLDCQFQILFQTTSQKSTQFEVRGQVDEVKLQIRRQQLTQMAHFAECMAIWSKRREYGKFRPEGWRPRWPRQANPDGGGVAWDQMWKYAIKSVLQDLHDLQPGFSLARLKLWQQWRRRYVALYLRHVETAEEEGQGVYIARELQELEAELPVQVVMLFRSIAEEALENKADASGVDDGGNQPSRVRGWLGWGMSGLWGFLGYNSSASMGPITLPEPPSEVEIAELYKALGLQTMQPGDNRQPQPAPLLASLRVEVSAVQATIHDEYGSAKESHPLISVQMSDCEAEGELETDSWHCSVSVSDLNVDSYCTPAGPAETIITQRELGEGSQKGGSFPIAFVSFASGGLSPHQSGKAPYLRIRLDPLHITVQPELIKRLQSLGDGFPTSTLSAWIARCISLLPTRRARMLAKAQHVAYSQSTLRTEIELHECLIHVATKLGGKSLAVGAELELLQLVSNPAEDAMDSVKVLREIERGGDLQGNGKNGMGFENMESVLFDDLERRLLYQRWAVTVQGLELMLHRLKDGQQESEVLVEKLSSTGNLLMNRMQEERSSPAIQCDCRCSSFGVTLTGSQLNSLNQIIHSLQRELQAMPNMNEWEGSTKEDSTGQCTATVAKKLSYGSLDVDMVLPEAPDSKIGIEFSLAAPKLRFVFEDTEKVDGTFVLGGNLPCSFVGVSQTVNIGISLQRSKDNISVSMQGFSLQDVGSYTGKKIMPKAKIPRLAKNINIAEVTLSVRVCSNGDISVSGMLDGADGTAYPGEVAGYLKPSSLPANAVGRFSFQRAAKSRANKLEICLENGCFGSTFLTRIYAQFVPDNSTEPCQHESQKHTEAAYFVGCGQDHAEVEGLVGPDCVHSFTLQFKLKNCHAVLPKGAQHMAGILGVPGGHCGALVKVSNLSLRAAFLDGFKLGQKRWSSVEIDKLHIRDAILMTSRDPLSCLLAPLVEVGEVKLTSAGTVFTDGAWPFEWHAHPPSISYLIEVQSPHLSVDLERLEVVCCALNEAVERAQSFVATAPAETSNENQVHPASSHGDTQRGETDEKPSMVMCVPYQDLSSSLRLHQLTFEMAGQSSSLCATFLEWKAVEFTHKTMYLWRRGGRQNRASTLSPFQTECASENDLPESKQQLTSPEMGIVLDTQLGNDQCPTEAVTESATEPMVGPLLDNDDLDIPMVEQCGAVHWDSLVLSEGRLDASSCFYYYLAPDGRILEHSKEDEADLIANETDNPGLAMALWAPVKTGEFEGQISGSASSVASFETAGSNFSIARRTGTNSTGVMSTADEELAAPQISRTISFNSNVDMDELWEDAGSLDPKKADNSGSSEFHQTDTGRVLLASISTSNDGGSIAVWWSKQLGGQFKPEVSLEASKLDVCVNVCSWTTTLHTCLEAFQIVKQYSSNKSPPPPPTILQSLGGPPSVKLSLAGFDLMIGSIREAERSAQAYTPLYPCIMLQCGAFSMGFSEEVSMSLGSFSVSSCWVACDDFGDRHWRIHKSADKVVLVGHVNMSGMMKVDQVLENGAVHEVGLKLSADSVKIWCSYHRSIPLLLVVDQVKKELALAPPDRKECGSPHDDSTSNKSSFLNIVSTYGGGSQHGSNLIQGFGKVEFQLSSISMLLSDDRSQTDFPLVDASVENLCFEAKREKESDLVVWGTELCPKLSMYNRQKMGWEVFVEPWSLKISAESRLNNGAVRQAGRPPLLAHTLLRCISDQSLQLTISPGMLQTVGILTELSEVMSSFSLDQCEIKPDLWEPGSYKSRFFTTHWLHNETGAAFYFWTTREGVGASAVAEESGMYVGAESVDCNGMPLRAVAVSERMMPGASAKRQLSLSEVTLARCTDSQIDSCGSTTTSGSGELPWFANSVGDSFKRNGKLPIVNEGDTKGTVVEGSERMPVGVGVIASGFSGEGHDPTYDHVSFSRHRHMRLYFKLESQECACGPVTLDRVGTSRHLVRVSETCSGPTPGTSDSERKWVKAEVICDVTQRKLGGFDVAMHSVARVCNETSMKLEVGCWEDNGLSSPAIKLVEPGKKMWLPVMTATKGTVCLRPHPESDDPWAMRWGWSQALTPQEVTRKLLVSPKIFSHLRCDPVSGGLKPIWLNLGARKNASGLFADIFVESPVVVHNFLPLMAKVTLRCRGGVLSGMRGKIEPRCCIKGHTLQGASIDHITLSPLGYNEAQVQSLPQVEALAKDVQLGELVDSTEDSKVVEAIVKVERESTGHVPVCIRHFVEGFTGRHIFEICCALWVYNCTGISVALREHQEDDHFVDEEAVRIPDDQVPNRWVPPYIDSKLEEAPSSSHVNPPESRTLSNPNLSMPESPSPMRHSRPVGEVGGLKDLLQTGDPVKFKIRTGWSAHHSPLERRALKLREPMGTKFPWMEVGGPPRQRRLRLQLRASRAQAPQGSDYWSSPLSVDSLGGAAIVQVPCPIHTAASRPSYPTAAYFFAVTAHPIPRAGGAWALHVMPRYILKNTTSVPIQYRQQGIPVERDLPVDACRGIQWPDARWPLRLNLRIREAGWLWSGGISLESPGDTFVKVRHRHREETMLFQVDVSMTGSGVLMASLSHQAAGFAPYRLDNCTNEKLHVRQEGCREQEDILRPYSSIPYAWDEPAGPHKIVLELAGHRHIGTMKLDEVGTAKQVTLRPDPSSPYTNMRRKLRIVVAAEGPTRVLVVMDEAVHPSSVMGTFSRSASHERLGWHSWSSPDMGQSSKQTISLESRVGLEVGVHLSGVGVSFVSSEKELLYAWISEPQLRFAMGKVRYTLECAVARFQLDNCTRSAVYPVLFRGPTTTLVNRLPAITLRASIWRRRPGGVVCLEQLHLNVAPLALEIEEEHMGEISQFYDTHIKTIMDRPSNSREKHEPDVIMLENGKAWSKITPRAKVYIESLVISKMDITFSFCPASWRFSSQEKTSLGGAMGSTVLQRFLALADVEAAQIYINGLELKHPLLSQRALGTLVERHYMRGLVQEVYKVVGSADLLGDPARLVHHLGLGVWSLFSNPAAALEETSTRLQIPQRVLWGLMVGVRSLMSNTIFAFSNATAKLSLTARKGLVVLGLEDEGRLRLTRRGMTRNARLALTESLDSGLVEAILGGLGGLLSEPVRGVDEAGLIGLFRGMVRGFVGVLVRPLARALEMSSHVAESIQVLVSGYQGPLPLMRVPRSVDPAAPLQPYDKLDAIGAVILREASNGVYKGDILLACLEISMRGCFAVVTHRHLLIVTMVEPNSLYSFPEMNKAVNLDEVELVKLKGTKVGLLGVPVLRMRGYNGNSRGLAGQQRSPFSWSEIECGDEGIASELAGRLVYACRHGPRRIKRVGWGVFVDCHI